MKRVMVYLTDEEYRQLRQAAFDEDISMSKILVSGFIKTGETIMKEFQEKVRRIENGKEIEARNEEKERQGGDMIEAKIDRVVKKKEEDSGHPWRTSICPKHGRMPVEGRWECCGE